MSSIKLKGTDEMARAYVSLIQSDYGRTRHGNFEAVIAHDTEPWHWFRDNSRNDLGPWVRGPRITSAHDTVAGPGCIIQSDYGTGPHRNFEGGFGADRSADLAGMYGPYQIPQYSRATDHGVQIYFTMSAWNPYQVMLMRPHCTGTTPVGRGKS